jgi:hypothetical protein
MTVRASSTSGLLRVTTRDRSPVSAVNLADAFVSQALNFVRALETLDGARFALGDFENGLGAWGAISDFAVPPSSLRIVSSNPKFNSAALEVTCPRRAGCGPAAHIYYPFRKGTTYEASGWLRAATSRVSVTMIFGADPRDYSALRPTRLRKSWTRYSLEWTPIHNQEAGELTVQSAAKRGGRFYVDGISFSEDSGASRLDARRRGVGEAKAFAQRPYAAATPAVPTGTVDSRTTLWALAGAALGFASAACGVGLGRLAASRG